MSAVTFDDVDSGTSCSSTNGGSVACGSGANRVHLVFVGREEADDAGNCTGVTIDGDAMTEIEEALTGTFSNPGVQIFKLTAGSGVREGSLTVTASFTETGQDYSVLFALCEGVSDVAQSDSYSNSTSRTTRYIEDGAPGPDSSFTMVDTGNRTVSYMMSDEGTSAITATTPAYDTISETAASNGFEYAYGTATPGTSTINYGVTSTNASTKVISLIELAEAAAGITIEVPTGPYR